MIYISDVSRLQIAWGFVLESSKVLLKIFVYLFIFHAKELN